MKKFLFLGTTLLTILLSSCDKEDIIKPEPGCNIETKEINNQPFEWDKQELLDRYIDQTFVIDPDQIYVGAVFPASSFGKHFDKEYKFARNPIDVVFDFQDPFITTISEPNGYIGYLEAVAAARNSQEFTSQIKSDEKGFHYFNQTTWNSYADLEKAFPKNSNLTNFFISEVKNNNNHEKVNSRVLIQFISEYFTVYMDDPISLFKENKNATYSQGDEPVYIKSITYGKMAFIAIESECSYDEISHAVKTIANKATIDKKIIDVMNKSTITVFAIGGSSKELKSRNVWSVLESIFDSSFNKNNYGYPICCQGRYVADGRIFRLGASDTN